MQRVWRMITLINDRLCCSSTKEDRDRRSFKLISRGSIHSFFYSITWWCFGLHLLTLCLPVMHDFIMLLATSEFFSYLNFVYSRKIAILNIKEYFKSYYECNECSDIGTKNRFMISIDEARCIPLNDVISLITFYD